MANTDQGQGPTFQPFSPAPDARAPRPDQGPSAAPPDAGSWAPPGVTPPAFVPQSRNPGQQRYFNVTPDRQPAEWGKPNWVLDGMKRYDGIASGPWAPQPHDVNNLVYQISHSLQQGGSMNVSALAASMGRNRGAFLKGYMQGQEWNMRMAKQQYELDAVRLADQQQKEATAAGEAIEANSDNPNQMWAELSRIADENNDQHLRTAIGSGKLDNVKKLLSWRDSHLLPLLQINEQRAKVEAEQARIESEREKTRTSEETRRNQGAALQAYGIPATALPAIGPGVSPQQQREEQGAGQGGTSPTEAPSAPGGTSSAAGGTPSAPAESGADDSAPPVPGLGGAGPQAAAAPAGQPQAMGRAQDTGAQDTGDQGQASEAPLGLDGGQPPPDPNAPRRIPTSPGSPGQPGTAPAAAGARQAPAPTVAPGGAGAPQINPNMRAVAHEILMGRKPQLGYDNTTNQIIYQRADQVAGWMRGELDRIGNDPRLTGDAALAAIARVDPDLASDVRNLRDGGRAPTGREAEKPAFQRVLGLTRKVDPSFNVNDVNLRYTTMRSFATGQDARTLTSMATSSHHLDALRDVATALGQYQFSSHSEYLNGLMQQYARQFGWKIPYFQSSGDDAADATRAYNTVLDMVAPEIARAVKGAAPAQREIEEVRNNLGSQVPARSLLKNIDRQRELIAARLGELKRRYDTGVGPNPRLGIDRLFTVETQQGQFGQGSQPPEGTVQPPPLPMPAGFDYAAGLRRAASYARPTDTGQAPGGGAPQAPAVGEVRRGWRYTGGDPSQQSSWQRQ
jgi:hypothetical protein